MKEQPKKKKREDDGEKENRFEYDELTPSKYERLETSLNSSDVKKIKAK